MSSTDRDDQRIRCSWDGDPASYPDFMRRVRLSFERTPRKRRHLLGPEVIGQLTGRAWIITQGLDHRLLVRRNGVIYLLEYLRDRLGRTPVPDVGHHYRQLQVALGRVRREQAQGGLLDGYPVFFAATTIIASLYELTKAGKSRNSGRTSW